MHDKPHLIQAVFELDWRNAHGNSLALPNPEGYLVRASEGDRPKVLRRLVRTELELRQTLAGQVACVAVLLSRFPGLREDRRELERLLREEVERLEARGVPISAGAYRALVPGECHQLLEDLIPDHSFVCPTQGCGKKLIRSPQTVDYTCERCGRLTRVERFLFAAAKPVVGGFGKVYRALDTGLERCVALKFPREQQGKAATLTREMKSAARLDHPNLVALLHFDVHEGKPYLVYPWIDGSTLHEQLEKDGPVPPKCAAEMLRTVAEAVHHAHEKHKLVHCDLKPANILLDEEGEPHVTDFGLAVAMDSPGGEGNGTRLYQAPEQLDGRFGSIGAPTDVYALGRVLYQTLTGQDPIVLSRWWPKRMAEARVRKQILEGEPPSLRRRDPNIPQELEAIYLKALSREPAGRYASAQAMADDLTAYLENREGVAWRHGVGRKLVRKVRTRWPLAVAVVALAAIVGCAYLGYRIGGEQEAARLRREFEAEIQRGDWSEEQAEKLHGIIDRMAKSLRRPEEANTLSGRLHQHFESYFRAQLEPRLDPDRANRLCDELRWFMDRDPARAEELRQSLERRRRSWQVIETLTAPFDRLPTGFGAADARVEQGTLVRGKPADDGVSVLTGIPCPEDARLKVTFADWESVTEVGLMLTARRSEGRLFGLLAQPAGLHLGYQFRLRGVPSTSRAALPRLGEVQKAGRPLYLQIVRDGDVLCERAVGVPDGPLTLTAEREGDRLQLQLNADSLHYHDVFPLPPEDALVGLLWPSGVRLTELTLSQRVRPRNPSPLEQADAHYVRGKYDLALAAYEKQAHAVAETPEGRCKRALCLIRQGQKDRAIKVLEPLSAEKHPRWSAIAACELALLRLEQRKLPDAQAALAQLIEVEDLNLHVSARLRWEIVRAYTPLLDVPNLLKPNPGTLATLNQALADAERLDVPPDAMHQLRLLLLEAHHADASPGRVQRDHDRPAPIDPAEREKLATARHRAEEFLQVPELEPWQRVELLRELIWLRLRLGELKEATDQLDVWLKPPAGDPPPEYRSLLLERARVRAAAGAGKEAIADLDQLFREAPPDDDWRLGAYLLLGALHDQAGREDEARKAWKAGRGYARSSGSVGSHLGSMLASLSGEMSVDDAQAALDGVIRHLPFNSQVRNYLRFQILVPRQLPILRAMWNTPRGRGFARLVALRQVSYLDYYRLQVLLSVAEGAHQLATPGPLAPDDDEIIWQSVHDLYDAYAKEVLNQTDYYNLALAMHGVCDPKTPKVGWYAVADKLKPLAPETRARIAYVFGHRYRREYEKDSATREKTRMFFRTALEAAPEGSAVRKLAREQLDALGKP